MPIPGQANIDRLGAQQQEEQAQEDRRTQNVHRATQLADTVRNFNDNPVGRIVGSQGGAPVIGGGVPEAAAAAPAAGAAAAGGEAAGAASALGELGEVASLAALA